MAARRSAERPAEDREILRLERLSQLRGLLLLAAGVLAWIFFRSDFRAIFHAGWWRL